MPQRRHWYHYKNALYFNWSAELPEPKSESSDDELPNKADESANTKQHLSASDLLQQCFLTFLALVPLKIL